MNAAANSKRWWLWAPLLALAFWLAVFGDKTPSGSALAPAASSPLERPAARPAPSLPAVAAQAATAQAPSETGSPDALEILVPRSQLILARKTDPRTPAPLFASGSWTPPPPPAKPVLPLPAPAPTAPALPFTFVGKKLEAGVWEVFLARGEQSFVVREGSVIENTYRVNTIAPPNLSLSYLPLGHTQSLSIGASE